MHETTGALKPAVEAYLIGSAPLTLIQIAALRAYLRQWIKAPVWDLNPYASPEDRAMLADLRHRIDQLNDRASINRWLHDAEALGMDPL